MSQYIVRYLVPRVTIFHAASAAEAKSLFLSSGLSKDALLQSIELRDPTPPAAGAMVPPLEDAV